MTYEYVCEACGHQWEAEQSIKDSPLKKCVSCGVDKAKRLISGGTGFLLKGGGWYADLYGSPGSGKGDDKSNKAASGTKPDSGAKSESSGATSESSGGGDAKGGGSDTKGGGGDAKPAASSTPSSSGSSSSSTSAAS
jgi:putative FmdB family regulatory protein